jgi:stress-induced-phosphoprotein 1
MRRCNEACIKNCEDAIEKGRELRVEYKMIGRAMTRKVRSSRAR